ncbi:malectin domain-containing carbohydrate-binding protein [Adhaeribacter radiodurans]|uniref:T9SS type A sorting domain-containing protein n=1 Tax=Adhaeribacter radiodurans TaxID=2745197 RepID=A0A7L7L3G7_9BACT|nr:malectin domain-containing carbohydrate-binding protein [Adhaeribacter radiodurans]QMU27337.1 T9SS type A sorting domain-containing protein [Adhaeribacter radiodurans]
MKKNYTITPIAHRRKWQVLGLIISLLTINNTVFAKKLVLADAPCSPISTLPCNQLSATLPFSLTFNSSVANSITDKNGSGTGFTMVDTYSGARNPADGTPSNASIPGYDKSKLTVSSGTLKIVSSKGIASTTTNNQINSLGVRVDSKNKLQIDVTIVNPFKGSNFEQGGLWFGLSDKTFVKLVATANQIEMRREFNDVSNSTDQRITNVISNLNTQTVRLRLVISSASNTVEGFYSTDGNTYLNVGATYTTKSLSIASMGLTSSTAYAGIFTSHRNATSPVTYTFDNFGVKSLTTPNPLSSNAYLLLENPDKLPAYDQLTFSTIQIPWRRTSPEVTPYNANHNRVKLKISNKGTENLVITGFALSNPSAWKLDTLNGVAYDPAKLPLTLASGASAELGIQFTAKDLGNKVVVLTDRLTISSNDNLAPEKEVTLRGLYQYKGEGVNEPSAQQIIDAFGFTTKTGYGHNDGDIDGRTLVPNSSEVAADYFAQVDPSIPVSLSLLGSYHGCCAQGEKIQWYDKTTPSTIKTLFFQEPIDAQSLLPRKAKSNALATATINTTGNFGFIVANSYSDRTKNFEQRLGMRFWKALDNNGNVIPNTYIFGTDYLGTPSTNYDYQDNVYILSNVRLANGTADVPAFVPTPSSLSIGSLLAGTNKSMSVKLTNQSASNVTINAVEVVGPNLSEFSADPPATAIVAAKGSTTINVTFKPTSRGLKNAALLVHYNGTGTPLRIPVYGVANDASFNLAIVKRIKGAADAGMTINGTTWEADKAYRQGSIKLDKQVVAGPIAATDQDVLYQSYLSAANNLAITSYQVPLTNGTYWIRMHFVENFFNGPVGSRVFSTTIENELRQSGFDIYREVGYRSALVKDFEVVVKDGALSIKYTPTANRVAIAAMEIYKANAATVTAVSDQIITDNTNAAALTIYPNPSTTGSQVDVVLTGFAAKQEVNLTVQDAMGRLFHTRQVTTNAVGAAQVDLSSSVNLPAGLYILNAESANTKAQAKLLIQ